MEIHRPSASAMRVPSRSPALEIRPNTSRGASQTSTTSSHSRAPMSIPGARIDEPPPPLPPPRYNEELDRGIDVSWSWQNNHEAHSGKRQLAPIKSGSSMFGGYMHPRGDTRRSSDVDEMDLDDWDRRGSTVSTIRSPSQADMGAGTTIPSLVRRPPSPASSNQRSVFALAAFFPKLLAWDRPVVWRPRRTIFMRRLPCPSWPLKVPKPSSVMLLAATTSEPLSWFLL